MSLEHILNIYRSQTGFQGLAQIDPSREPKCEGYIGLEFLKSKYPEATLEKFVVFARFLEKWNKIYNLTAAKNAQEILFQHILDSLSIAPYLCRPNVLDVGTGAGFPGIPLALALPGLEFTLLDSQSKKTRFLNQAVVDIGIKNASVVRRRIEDFNSERCFATIVTRATFSLSEMLDKTRQLLCPNGCLLLMKGRYPKREIAELNARERRCISIHKLAIAKFDIQRHLLCYRKNP